MRKTVMTSAIALAVAFSATFGSAMAASTPIGTPSDLFLNVAGGNRSVNDVTPTFYWSAPSGATWYEAAVDNQDWLSIGNTHSYTASSTKDGWHTFYVRAHNNAGETSLAASYTFEIDTVGPTVSAVTPTTVQTGVLTSFSWTSTGEASTSQCWWFVDGIDQGDTYNNIGKAAFTKTGSHTVYVRCVDGDGNYGTGKTITIAVTQGATNTVPNVSVTTGELLKPKCQSYEPKVGTCHSVYYFGADGMAHAFPSEAVYQSWYGASFANVKEIETWQFNRIAIGENVTLHPGSVLVKFSDASTVYAVEKGGILHPFMTEAAAIATYGSSYNLSIVLMPTSMKSDYTIGSKIWSSSDYNKTTATASVHSIDENF